jgi:predicted kinase
MPKVIVLQGPSGVGKSTIAKKLIDGVPQSVIVSTDDSFINEAGVYEHDLSKLGEAHGACFRSFLRALEADKALIIVDNTNTCASEISPYMLAASAFGYEAAILRIECSVEKAAARNLHGTPLDVVQAMAARVAEPLPPYWTVETITND